MNSLKDIILLANDVPMPVVGFGTWQTPDDEIGYNAVLEALKVGYRHIDTAAAYGNEATVGRAIKDSGIPRDEIFVTTKLWNNIRGYEETKAAIDESLELLGLDYLDLYLIHWPCPMKFREDWITANAESWRAMEEYYNAGKIKAIGVSNFEERHLEPLMEKATVMPTVNQIRLCPGDAKETLVAYCREKNIVLEAYSPLGTGKVFEVDELKMLAEKYDTTVAKVSLRWSLQMGFIPLPKSVTAERIASNADIFGFELSDDDMDVINSLNGCCGLSTRPEDKPF